MQNSNQRRFIAACVRFGVECRPYDGAAVENQRGVYIPDYRITTNGMVCAIETGSHWLSKVTIEEACLELDNFYIMTHANLALVELGRFRFVPLHVDLARVRSIRDLEIRIAQLTAPVDPIQVIPAQRSR